MESSKKERFINAINFLLEEGNLKNKASLGEILNVESSGNLSQLLSLKYSRKLTERQEDSFLSSFPQINPGWYFTGEGPMLKSPTPEKRMQEVEILGAQEELYIPVPFLDMGVQAGWLMDFNNPEPKAQDDVEMRYVSPEFRFGTHIVAVVRGDSMDDGTKRSISEGDEILLRLVDDFEWNGLAILNNLYVIVTQEGTVLKQITKLERSENGYINCHSFNSLYPDYRIELSEVRWFFKVCRVVNRRISI